MTYTEQEKNYMELIENNLQFFNVARRKKLTVKYYVVADQNKVKVLWGNVTVANDLTIQEAHAFCWGFTRAKEGR